MINREKSAFHEQELTPWEDLGAGVRRQIMGYDDQIMMVKVAFEAGAIGNLHQHIHSQVTYVASGKFEVVINQQRKTIAAGDGFYAEPNSQHGVLCLEAGVLIDVFTPHRADFLAK